jgi:hypothetical protein
VCTTEPSSPNLTNRADVLLAGLGAGTYAECACRLLLQLLQGAGKPEDHFIIPPVFIGGGTKHAHRVTLLLAQSEPAEGLADAVLAAAEAGQVVCNVVCGICRGFQVVWQHKAHVSEHCSSRSGPYPLRMYCLLLQTYDLHPHVFHAALDAYVFLRDNKAFEEETHKILARTVSQTGPSGIAGLRFHRGVCLGYSNPLAGLPLGASNGTETTPAAVWSTKKPAWCCFRDTCAWPLKPVMICG